MKYNAKEIEEKYYKICEDRGYFEIDGNKSIQKKEKYFSIMMPPPNITGSLHIGHALTFTLQDIITRYKRMDGYKTLWQPGTDHAGIATQNIVEKQLLKEGLTKNKIGRKEFIKKAWLQKEKSGKRIIEQLKKLGVSSAWKRERFTMDEGMKEAVKEAFISLYKDGYISQNKYMVNWCIKDGAISDIEVKHYKTNGKLYHLIYKFVDGSGEIEIATTRPETYFGDTAIMVHPDDIRYKNIIGKEVFLPRTNRSIKIISDKYVDIKFGTGIVKVTPAHDQNDYIVGKRHNLEFIKIFNEKGILNSLCGEFSGLDRLEAREKIISKLQENGHISKIQEHIHQIGHCYRCSNIIEPFISTQWFLSEKIAKSSVEKTKSKKKLFYPSHWINSYKAWMDELRPWCISRQLWWGHRIPIFNCNICSNQWADKADKPEYCPKCKNKNIVQDSDVLDTWFSSALWAMSPLGWGNNGKLKELYNKNDIKEFYPNSLLITGFDIMFFWVARMMMMGDYFQGELPFKDIYMHSLVKDKNGAKMSKSKGNVIDPLDMVEKHSADIIRFTLAYLAAQGRDIKLAEKNLEQFRNFTNKLYNATNYLQLNINIFPNLEDIQVESIIGKYMQTKLSKAVEEVRNKLDNYKFNESASTLYNFVWNEFCDLGIEYSKAEKNSIPEIGAIFKETLKLISPFMPFISDYLYHKLNATELEKDKSVMIMNFPNHKNIRRYPDIELDFLIIQDIIKTLRRVKILIDMGNNKIEKGYIILDGDPKSNFYQNFINSEKIKAFIQTLGKVEKIEFHKNKEDNYISETGSHCIVHLPINEINIENILSKKNNQKEKIEKEIEKLNKILNNKKFIENAPQIVIKENKEALNIAINRLNKILGELRQYKG